MLIETKAKLSERLHLSDARYDLSGFIHQRAVDSSVFQMSHSHEASSTVEPPKPVQRILGVPSGPVPVLLLAATLPFDASARRGAWVEKQRIGDS